MDAELDTQMRVKENRTAQLAEVQRIARLASWEWDVATGEVMWSPELFELFGVDPNGPQPTYERFLECVHPDDRLLVHGAIERARETGTEFRIAHRVVRPDGEERMVLCRAQVFRSDDGAATRMVGATLDLSDLRSIGDDLRSRHAQLVAAEEVAGTGSWEWDIEADRIAWSDGMHRVYGRPEGDAPASMEAFQGLVYPEDRKGRRARIDELLASGESMDSEYRIGHPGGAVRWIRSTARVIRAESGGAVRLIGVCRDITDERAG